MDEIKKLQEFQNEEEFYLYFEKNGIHFDEAVQILITTNTFISMYVIIQIFGNDSISLRFNWVEVKECDFKYFKSLKNKKAPLFKHLYPNLMGVKQTGILGIHKLIGIPVKELEFNTFSKEFCVYVEKRNTLNDLMRKSKEQVEKISKRSIDDAQICEKYDYGLSDW